jgi:hypothetical protein
MKPITDKQRLDWLDKSRQHVEPFPKLNDSEISFFAVGGKGYCSVRQAIDRGIRAAATEPKKRKRVKK